MLTELDPKDLKHQNQDNLNESVKRSWYYICFTRVPNCIWVLSHDHLLYRDSNWYLGESTDLLKKS